MQHVRFQVLITSGALAHTENRTHSVAQSRHRFALSERRNLQNSEGLYEQLSNSVSIYMIAADACKMRGSDRCNI